MFRNLPDCVETLEDAKSCYWTLKGQGTEIKYEPEADAATADAAILAFEKAYERLGSGIYTLEHRVKQADNRGRQSFRFNKAPEAPAGVAGPGGDVHTYLQLHQQIQALQHQRELDQLAAKHAEEVRALRAKVEEAGESGTDKIMNIVAGLNNLFDKQRALQFGGRGAVGNVPRSAESTISTQAGAPAQAPADLAHDDATADAEVVVNQLVSGIHRALGEDDAVTMDALRKLAAKAQSNPGQIKQLLSFI